MATSYKKQQERKKMWIRIICGFLCVVLVASTIAVIFA